MYEEMVNLLGKELHFNKLNLTYTGIILDSRRAHRSMHMIGNTHVL